MVWLYHQQNQKPILLLPSQSFSIFSTFNHFYMMAVWICCLCQEFKIFDMLSQMRIKQSPFKSVIYPSGCTETMLKQISGSDTKSPYLAGISCKKIKSFKIIFKFHEVCSVPYLKPPCMMSSCFISTASDANEWVQFKKSDSKHFQ